MSTETDLRSAAAHIEGLLDMTPGAPDEAAPVETAPEHDNSTEDNSVEDAPEETSASGETEEQSETEETPSIEAPPSWNADEKAKFKELPPELQQVVARRESERDKAISQRMQQFAEQRKAIEADVVQANQAQTQYAQTLQQLLTLSIPELEQIERTDFMKLAESDPVEYVRLTAVRDGLRQRVGFMHDQISQAQQQQNQQFLARHQDYLAQQYEQLVQHVPEFKDENKAKAVITDIGRTMAEFGFSDQEIGSVADARIVRAMARLASLEKAEAARKSVQTKKSGGPAPRLMQPNATPGRETNTNRVMADQYKALRKSGNARDAARLIENIL